MKRLRTYDENWLKELVSNSLSYREVLIKAGRAPNGGESYRLLKNKIEEYNIDTSHFTGRSTNSGERHKGGSKDKYRCEEVFKKNSPVTQRVLRHYVEKYHMIIHECAICGFEGDT